MGKRGRTPVVYTLERAQEVRRRVREEGERVTSVCADMGMNYENFLRWCRRNHFEVHTLTSRKQSRHRSRGPYLLGSKVNPPRKFRPGSKAAILVEDLRAGNLSPGEIAEKYGVTYPYVIRVRKLAALNPPAGKGRNIRNPRNAKNQARTKRNQLIWQELEQGYSQADIARRHCLSRQRIQQIKKLRPGSE